MRGCYDGRRRRRARLESLLKFMVMKSWRMKVNDKE